MRTSNPGLQRRLPAEWEPQQCVIMAWPHSGTDWAPILTETLECYRELIGKISAVTPVLVAGPDSLCHDTFASADFDPQLVKRADVETNDTWARDFGPITIETPDGLHALDFKFNGWGLKFAADCDNLITMRLSDAGLIPGKRENRLNFVLEGGSIESDGCGTILTTSECLLSYNRNGGSTKEEIEDYLKNAFGAQRVLWIDHGALAGDDTDSHIDTLARLAPDDTIVYCGPGDDGDPNNPGLEVMREELRSLRTTAGGPYRLVELPLPSPIHDEDGMQLPATYANFLISNGTVFMPVYAQPDKDALAAERLSTAFPNHRIETVDCRALIKQHGSLHCVTMQIPKEK